MHPLFVPRIGVVLSADIAVPEHARELAFYASVLGTGSPPLWREDLSNNLGLPVIGLGERNSSHERLPLQWMPHIHVADVARSAARAVAAGGSELMHGKADDGTSQWAVLADPNGAAFGIVPAPDSGGAPSETSRGEADDPSGVGRIAWLDLTVDDADATRAFYEDVIGWGTEAVPMKVGDTAYSDYCMIPDRGEAAAGICHARGANEGLPPVWLLHLPVGDLDESVRRVDEGGGTVVKEHRGDDGRLTTAIIRDPVGAHLALAR